MRGGGVPFGLGIDKPTVRVVALETDETVWAELGADVGACGGLSGTDGETEVGEAGELPGGAGQVGTEGDG